MSSDNILHLCDDISIDKRQMSILVEGNSYKMNYNEFHILSYLIENNNKIISKDVLLSVGWPDNVVTDASLHRSIFSLRAVLSPSNIEIKTISGRGYLLIIDSKCIENKNKEDTNKHGITCKKTVLKKNIILVSILFFSISIINIIDKTKDRSDFIDSNFTIVEIKNISILKSKKTPLPKEFVSKITSNPINNFYFFNKNKFFYEISSYNSKTKNSHNYFIKKEDWPNFIDNWGVEN